ncbi:MAG TPA: condensation domain-containing protein, partial [Acidobacteriaceae bacterium]
MPLLPQSRTERVSLSYAQERLWILEQLGIPKGAYTISTMLRLRGKLDLDALKMTLETLITRHESLRTRFLSEDGVPYQVIDAAGAVSLVMEDLRWLETREGERRVQEAAREEASRGFNLETGPLFQVRLLSLGEDENAMLLSMHHIISDGWSMGIMVREFSSLYGGYVSGTAAELPPLPVQYADYALWQRGWLHGEVLERQRTYWLEQLSGAPAVLELPTDYLRPERQSFRGATVAMKVERKLTDELNALAQREGATLFMALLAAFQLLLSRWSGQTDVVVGTPIASRTESAAEGVIGFFVNTLALRANVDGSQSFRELLGQVRERTLGAYAHQDLPFEQVVALLAHERDPSRQPVFQTMLALQNTPSQTLKVAELEIEPFDAETTMAKFDVTLSLYPEGEGLNGCLEYAADLFAESTVERMRAAFLRILDTVVAEPEKQLGSIDLLSSAERDQ